jgi:tetratricopeptide (TPR) repeat protein
LRQIRRNGTGPLPKSDHAPRLTFLWPALRQLASTPYTDPRFFEYRDLWQRLAGAWDTSAAWYGLHNCSPISKLAAANTLAWLADNDPSTSTTTLSAGAARGPRASALYSLAKRCWVPWQRARLFRLAKDDIKAVLAASPDESSNVIAVRGSANLQLWRLHQAVADYEAVVAMRTRLGASLSAQGEAWTELGWGYFWLLRFSKSLAALRRGVAMMPRDFERDPTTRVDFYIRGLMKHAIVSLLTLNLHEGAETLATACKLAQKRIANDQVRGFRRLLCRVLDTVRSTGHP